MALTAQDKKLLSTANPALVSQAESLIIRGKTGAARGDPQMNRIIQALIRGGVSSAEAMRLSRSGTVFVEGEGGEVLGYSVAPESQAGFIQQQKQAGATGFLIGQEAKRRKDIEVKQELGFSQQPYFEQRVVSTFEKDKKEIPITQLYYVGETGEERRATMEEEMFFREQPSKERVVFREEERGLVPSLFAVSQLDFEPIRKVVKEKRREIVQREEPGFKRELVGFGLGVGASAITTMEFAKGVVTEPVKTVKEIPKSVVFATEFLSSGAAAELIKTEPGFVTGFIAGEVVQFKVATKVLKGKKKTPPTEEFQVEFIKPQKITKTPLSRTFAEDIFIGGEKDFLLKPFKPTKPIDLGLKRFKELERVRTAKETTLAKLEAPKMAFEELISKESKIFVGKEKDFLLKPFLEIKPKKFKPTKPIEFSFDIEPFRRQKARLKSEADIFIIDRKGLPRIVEKKPRFRKRKRGLFEFDFTEELKGALEIERKQPKRFDIIDKGYPKLKKKKKPITFDLTPELKQAIKFEKTQPKRFDLVGKADQQLILEKPKQVQKQIQKEFKIVEKPILKEQKLALKRFQRQRGLLPRRKKKEIYQEIKMPVPEFQEQIQVPKQRTQQQLVLLERPKQVQKSIQQQFQTQTGRFAIPEYAVIKTAQRFQPLQKQFPIFKSIQKDLQAVSPLEAQRTRQALRFREGFAQAQPQLLRQPQVLIQPQIFKEEEFLKLRLLQRVPRVKKFKKPKIDFGWEDPFSTLRVTRKFKRTPSLGAVLQYELTGFGGGRRRIRVEETGLVERGFEFKLPKVEIGSLLGKVTKISSKNKKKNKKKNEKFKI